MEKLTWIPLESNPETFNQYIENLGIKGIECVEVYGFDDDLLNFIPRPCYGIVLCYPYSDRAKDYIKKTYTAYDANCNTKDVFFMKQKIKNACGTFALLHVLTNITEKIDIAEAGPFASWYQKAKLLDVQERSDSLAKNAQMANAHRNCADSGETAAPEANQVEYHFIAYVNTNGRLMELDSAQNFPIEHGLTNDQTMLTDAVKHCKQLMEILESVNCNALAIVRKNQ